MYFSNLVHRRSLLYLHQRKESLGTRLAHLASCRVWNILLWQVMSLLNLLIHIDFSRLQNWTFRSMRCVPWVIYNERTQSENFRKLLTHKNYGFAQDCRCCYSQGGNFRSLCRVWVVEETGSNKSCRPTGSPDVLLVKLIYRQQYVCEFYTSKINCKINCWSRLMAPNSW